MATSEQQSFIEEASALISNRKISQVRDLLYARILQIPNDYKARNLLRKTFEAQDQKLPELDAGHHCPCCGNSFSVFLPGGPSFRPNACCPACESLERHRFLCLFLPQLTVWGANCLTMLHIAAELCLQGQFRSAFGRRYFTMDLHNSADFKGDLCSLPISSQSIDIVMANHVLEHVQDDIAAMREIFRVIKHKGKAFLQVPLKARLAVTKEAPDGATPQDLLRLFGQEDHVRIYGMDFLDRLEGVGFTVRKHVCKDVVSAQDIRSYGLLPEEACWEATKT